LGYKDETLAVIAPLNGTPAERAGVRAGDLILKIEDQDTLDISLPEAVDLIRGPKGSTVKLTLLHEGDQESYEAPIIRDTILVPSVELEMVEASGDKKLAHLKLMRFGERTSEEWHRAVGQLVRECRRPSDCGVILDLRNNPGGLLTGSVFIGSEFLKSGVVVIQESADGTKEKYSVDRQGQLLDVPLVVLVNQGSASASEIVAGALQEKNRAEVVGEPTFGKGTIQEAQDFDGGAGLHVTVARWLLPSGQSVEEKGIAPDYLVEDDYETEIDEPLEKAKELLR
jgi:carboxyl-terminal processing protease